MLGNVWRKNNCSGKIWKVLRVWRKYGDVLIIQHECKCGNKSIQRSNKSRLPLEKVKSNSLTIKEKRKVKKKENLVLRSCDASSEREEKFQMILRCVSRSKERGGNERVGV